MPAAVFILYSGSLSYPIVFDDIYFFIDPKTAYGYGDSFFHFSLRWLPYASLGWTANIFGLDLISFRLGNLFLHVVTTLLLFVFLRRLFDTAKLPTDGLSSNWLAFFGALIFSLHPAAVYGVAYLIQRTILMATLFVLLMLLAYWRGLERNQTRWLVAAALFYFLAVFSKEHSIMAPALALVLTLLLRTPSVALFKQVAWFYVLSAAIGLLVVLKLRGVLGAPYEMFGPEMLKRMAEAQGMVEIEHAHILSVITQSAFFFKYLLLWLIPNPAWMSVDMREPFAVSWWSWPHTIGFIAFWIYPLIAGWLLLQRGIKGLWGLALLFPWVLFFTEFASIRIQEPFVLYRSYLWMAGLVIVFPLLFIRVQAKRAAIGLGLISVLMVPLAWNRLTTFSHPLLLWDDAATLVEGKPYQPGMERIFHNRGIMLSKTKLKQEAIDDYTTAINMKPDYSYAYSDRGAMYYEMKRFAEALQDFDTAITLNPTYPNPYQGRGLVYVELGDRAKAMEDFRKSCELGRRGCDKLKELSQSSPIQ
ncbi:MAG: tetratricopeptide repeat protein [Pseudomonadota bacterium]